MRYIHQEERKTLHFHYQTSEATKRTYAPQGLLGLMTGEMDPAEYILEVDLDDPFFRTVKVDVTPPKDYTTVGLLAATLALDYGDPAEPKDHKHQDLVFRAGDSTARQVEWFMNSRRDVGFTMRREFTFDPDAGWDGEKLTYALPPVTTDDRSLTLLPQEHLGFHTVVVRPDLDAAKVRSVSVALRWPDGEGEDVWAAERTIQLVPGGEPQTWRVRTSDKEARTYMYRLTYHLEDGSEVTTDEVGTRAAELQIPNPVLEGATP
jgi:hypothetical protein